jgi:hypothetical protein
VNPRTRRQRRQARKWYRAGNEWLCRVWSKASVATARGPWGYPFQPRMRWLARKDAYETVWETPESCRLVPAMKRDRPLTSDTSGHGPCKD